MTNSIHKLKQLLPAFLLPAIPGFAQLTNPDFVQETAESFIAQPDLDGDGTPDIVVVDRSTGIIRPAIFDGDVNWLEPVSGGVTDVDAVASGNFEDFARDSIALASESANRIKAFSFDGDTLNRSPRSVFNEVWGVSELAALEEASSETPGTIELVGLSNIFIPESSGIRDFMTLVEGELTSYPTGYSEAPATERAHNHFLGDIDTPLLGFFREAEEGFDLFILTLLLDGSFEEFTAESLFPAGTQVIHASFIESGEYQFLFYIPGSTECQVYAWNGGGLELVEAFLLSSPASQLFPIVMDGFAGFFALSMDSSTITPYAFDGFSPAVPLPAFAPTAGESINAAFPLPDGNLLLLSGDPASDPSSESEIFSFNGSSFVSEALRPLPDIRSLTTGSNVLLFAETPFINENPSITGRLGAGVWTSAVAVGTSVEAAVESYGGTTTGLNSPSGVNLGTPPPGTSDALGNQVDADISLSFSGAAVGAVPGSVSPDPEPGTYAQSISVSFIPTDPLVEVFYRTLPDGTWEGAGGPVGPYFEDIEIAYFGLHPDGRRTPIQTAAYSISTNPSDLDSDGDGIPDYVEIANGLDPVNSGDDGDGDGYSDLIELLAGSNPANALSLPPGREVDSDEDGYSDLEETIAGTNAGDPSSFPSTPGVLNFQNVYDLVAVPYSHDGTSAANPFVSSLEEELETLGGDPLATNVRLYNASAALAGFDRTALHNLGGITHPSAYIDEVPIANPDLFMVVATDRTFNIDVLAADQRLGRQIVALVQIPEASLAPVPYTFGSSGGVLSTEAGAWVSAAQSHYLSIDRPLLTREFNLFDTLSLLLAEKKIEDILEARGILSGDPFTLTGFRSSEVTVNPASAPGDGSRKVVVPPSTLNDLRYKAGPSLPGYRLEVIREMVEQTVDFDPATNVQALRAVAEEIYRISAATANDNPGTLLPPLDALRQFLRTGSLANTGYGGAAPLDPATLASAYTAVPYILGKEMARPVEFRELEVPAGGLTGGCTILEDTTSGESVSLINFQGDPFPFPDAFTLPAGAVIIVEGYADVDSACGADLTLEVIPQPQLVTLPVQSTGDLNANLVPDDLEDLYPLPLDPFGDSDNDGYTDLQEILSGSNPLLDGDFPADPPVNLGPPSVAIDDSGPNFVFSFAYPEAYADDLNFRLFSGSDLQSIVNDTGFDAVHTGGGAFELIINKPASYPVFYRFKMLLD
jgi:hypothetical protein